MSPIPLSPTARIGIVNRGEAALRFIRAVRDHNALHGTRISPVAFYLAEEEHAPFVRQADLAVLLTDAPGSGETVAYLDRERMASALAEAGCQAVWAGWGFLSEDSAFVRLIEERGMAFLGPSWQSMERLGDKVSAKELAEQAGVPVLPWSKKPVSSLREAETVAKEIGFPCMIKAAGAGGGRGIRAVRTPQELEAQYRSARDEAIWATGGDRLFIERLVTRARHLEVQAVADRHGNVLTFGVRDCSVQRRNQKIIEETPPPGLDAALLADIESSASRLIKAAGYEGAGTVEFLYDLETGKYTFMEVNARLQVEHPITEQAYGVDLVQLQIRVALGEPLPDETPRRQAAAMEVRLNAEDPERDFAPAPGDVLYFQVPAGPGVRIDSGVEEGNRVPSRFDSMVAKIITFGPDRSIAFARMERALAETRVLLKGGTTNLAFLRELLRQTEIQKGGVSTRFVEQLLQAGSTVISREKWTVALAGAAVERYLAAYREELANFRHQLAGGGQPRELSRSDGLEVGLRAAGREFVLKVCAVAPYRWHIHFPGTTVPVEYHAREHESLLSFGRERFSIQTVERAGGLQVEVDGVPYMLELDSGGIVHAQSPGLVLSLPVKPGDRVRRGDVVVVLEAMKMETLVLAPQDGTVAEFQVQSGEQVFAGQPLLRLEAAAENHPEQPAGGADTRSAPNAGENTPQIRLAENEPEAEGRILNQEYLAVFLGFDHDRDGAALLGRMARLAERDPDYRLSLADILVRSAEIYIDIERLFAGPAEADSLSRRPVYFRELLAHYFRRRGEREKGMPEAFVRALRSALRRYLADEEIDADPTVALLHVYRSHADLAAKQELLREALLLMERLPRPEPPAGLSDLFDEVAWISRSTNSSLADTAIYVRSQLVDRVLLERWRAEKRGKVGKVLELLLRRRLRGRPSGFIADSLVNTGHHVAYDLVDRFLRGSEPHRPLILEILARRFTRDRRFLSGELVETNGFSLYVAVTGDESRQYRTFTAAIVEDGFDRLLDAIDPLLAEETGDPPEVVLLAIAEPPAAGLADEPEERLLRSLTQKPLRAEWVSLGVLLPGGVERFHTYHYTKEGRWEEDPDRRGFNPRAWRELRVGRLKRFDQERVYSSESVHLLHLQAPENPKDERLIALVEVPAGRPQLDKQGRIVRMIALENVFMEAIFALRSEQARRRRRLQWNRIVVHIPVVMNTTLEQNREYAARLAARTGDLGLEKITVYSRRPTAEGGVEEVELLFENISGVSFTLRGREPVETPLEPMDPYVARVVRARQRGTLYPYEILKMITRAGYPVSEAFPKGEFAEYDIRVDDTTGTQEIVSVKNRPPGQNNGNVVFGILTSYPASRPDGLHRVAILSDPTTDMGSLAQPECRRVIAALDLAEQRRLPVEWLPVSAGARIEMESGTENLDWTARVLRRIVRFTESGGEINIIVAGINIGAQSYWNAEATMLMHTRGLLVMTEDAAMLLTGKKALDFSGSVSTENNVSIGGVERIMGPNGQAQLRARSLYEAYSSLMIHYELTASDPDTGRPARRHTSDRVDRNVGLTPYEDMLGQGFSTIGDIFSEELNPERKKPFDMRQVLQAVVDQDGPVFERWAEMKDAEVAIIWEARLGGYAAGVIGIESRPLPRIGEVPHDGPESWAGGTLFPLSSKKIARGINAFSGRLPLVILANLSGFDGSPESLRKLQLEYGAEIGRAIVNFQGPILFVVTARYHGGAYVVFSKALNDNLHAAALEGAYASVIGGAPAAAVVFPGLVLKETNADPRIVQAREKLQTDRAGYQQEFDDLFRKVYAEKQSALARRFDRVHSVERARSVGSIDDIIPLSRLRPWLIGRLEQADGKLQP